jgi:hypothetical protein
MDKAEVNSAGGDNWSAFTESAQRAGVSPEKIGSFNVGVNPATAFVPNAMDDAGGPMGMGAQKMTPEEEAISAGIIANQQKRRAAKAF